MSKTAKKMWTAPYVHGVVRAILDNPGIEKQTVIEEYTKRRNLPKPSLSEAVAISNDKYRADFCYLQYYRLGGK